MIVFLFDRFGYSCIDWMHVPFKNSLTGFDGCPNGGCFLTSVPTLTLFYLVPWVIFTQLCDASWLLGHAGSLPYSVMATFACSNASEVDADRARSDTGHPLPPQEVMWAAVGNAIHISVYVFIVYVSRGYRQDVLPLSCLCLPQSSCLY